MWDCTQRSYHNHGVPRLTALAYPPVQTGCQRSWHVCVSVIARPGALALMSARRSLCRGPALSRSVSGPGQCVRPRRSPALSVSGPGALCVGARWSYEALLSGPGALRVGPHGPSSEPITPIHFPNLQLRLAPSSRSTCHPFPSPPAGPQLRSACHPVGPCAPNPRATHPVRAGPQLKSACHPFSPARSFLPGENFAEL